MDALVPRIISPTAFGLSAQAKQSLGLAFPDEIVAAQFPISHASLAASGSWLLDRGTHKAQGGDPMAWTFSDMANDHVRVAGGLRQAFVTGKISSVGASRGAADLSGAFAVMRSVADRKVAGDHLCGAATLVSMLLMGAEQHRMRQRCGALHGPMGGEIKKSLRAFTASNSDR